MTIVFATLVTLVLGIGFAMACLSAGVAATGRLSWYGTAFLVALSSLTLWVGLRSQQGYSTILGGITLVMCLWLVHLSLRGRSR